MDEPPVWLDEIAREVVDAGYKVYSKLGAGFRETVYHEAMKIELDSRGIRYRSEQAFSVVYCGHQFGSGRVDLIVEDSLLVELKATSQIVRGHVAQVLHYLQGCELPLGLIINFGAERFKGQVRRVVRSEYARRL